VLLMIRYIITFFRKDILIMLDLNSFKKIMDSLFISKDFYEFSFDKEIQASLDYLSSKA